MMEFSIVLFIKRKDEICCKALTIRRRNDTDSFVIENSESRAKPFLLPKKNDVMETNIKNQDCENDFMDNTNEKHYSVTDAIDVAALFVFSFSYILFLSMYMGWYIS
jgi:hypothetical protein